MYTDVPNPTRCPLACHLPLPRCFYSLPNIPKPFKQAGTWTKVKWLITYPGWLFIPMLAYLGSQSERIVPKASFNFYYTVISPKNPISLVFEQAVI